MAELNKEAARLWISGIEAVTRRGIRREPDRPPMIHLIPVTRRVARVVAVLVFAVALLPSAREADAAASQSTRTSSVQFVAPQIIPGSARLSHSVPFLTQLGSAGVFGSGGENCGPASVAMVIGFYGGSLSVPQAAEAIRGPGRNGRNNQGTGFGDWQALLREGQRHLHEEAVGTQDEMRRAIAADQPVIVMLHNVAYRSLRPFYPNSLYVNDGNGWFYERDGTTPVNHFVVVTGYDAGFVYVNDSLLSTTGLQSSPSLANLAIPRAMFDNAAGSSSISAVAIVRDGTVVPAPTPSSPPSNPQPPVSAPPVVAPTTWSVSLSVSTPESVPGGVRVSMTAGSSPDVGPSPYWLTIVDLTTGQRQQRCANSMGCSKVVTITSGTPHTYIAYVSYVDGSGVQAQSASVVVSGAVASPVYTPPPPPTASQSGPVVLCGDIYYASSCQSFSTDNGWLLNETIGNDRASSMRVSPGWNATIYQDWYFQGRSWCFTGDEPDFTRYPGLNDAASSIRVRAGGCGQTAAPSPTLPPAIAPQPPAPYTPPVPPPAPALTPPSSPMPLSPSSTAVGSQAPVTLIWTGVVGSSSYEMELWGGPYSVMTACSPTSSTICPIGVMIDGGPYYWHVRARNTAGVSPWSDTASFSIGSAPVADNVPASVQPPPYRPTHAGMTVSYLGNNFRSDDGRTWMFQGSDADRARTPASVLPAAFRIQTPPSGSTFPIKQIPMFIWAATADAAQYEIKINDTVSPELRASQGATREYIERTPGTAFAPPASFFRAGFTYEWTAFAISNTNSTRPAENSGRFTVTAPR